MGPFGPGIVNRSSFPDRKLWFRVEQRADVSRALPAYRAVATDIEAWNAALAPPTLHLCNVEIERGDHLGTHDGLLLAVRYGRLNLA